MTAAVAFEEVSCAFGQFIAVDRVSLEVREGEFFTLLGPSG
jgi:putative spermidine/putrescine transport system ATP-binding protein